MISVLGSYPTKQQLLTPGNRWRTCTALAIHMLLVCLPWFSTTATASDYLLDMLEHHRWTVADEGPSQVGALAQTRDGYLWLGTNDSLYRFDGLDFARYTPPDGNPLGIISVLKAEDEGLWAGLRTGGISLITDTGITTYPVSAGLPGGVVYSIAKDHSGAVWIAANDGLARFDGNAWQRIGTDWNFPGRHARAVLVDRDGTLWAANEDRLFYLPSGARAFVDAGIAVGWVSQMAQAPDGAIWMAERYGGSLRRIVPSEGDAATQVTVIDGANGLLFDSAGAIWVGTSGKGVRYVPASASLNALSITDALDHQEAFMAKDGLSADNVLPILEDVDGNIWVGTSAGLDRFRPSAMVSAAFPHNAQNFALVAGAAGSVWAGTSNLPAMRLSSTGLTTLDIPAPISNAFGDANGDIWMAGSNGIWRAQGDKIERVASLPTQDALDSAVRAMTLDQAGDLWVSINRKGLFVLRDGRWSIVAPPNADPSQLMPVSATTDPLGRLWFGYRNNLIVTHDGKVQRHWGADEGLKVGHVTAMLHQGHLTWVGGQRGVAFFDGERFHSLHLPDNGLFDNIYAILAVPPREPEGDGSYDLWLHGKAGVYQLTARELKRAIADPLYQIGYRSYEVIGGLANDPHQVLPLPTAVRSTDGRLWFSTSKGVTWIDPTRYVQSKAAPKVVIQSFNVDGKEPPPSELSRLGAEPRSIEISYTALSLSGMQGLHFRYLLEGFDTDWQQAGSKRSAIYTGLGPGDYRFRVLASNQDGLLSTEEAVLSFSIRPVFYHTPLFIVLSGLAVVSVLWMLHRFNIRRSAQNLRDRLEERHAERERIARELHDTLLQGVQGLMLSFQAATEQIPSTHPARGRMERALDRADQVLVEARERVNNLRDLNEPALNLIDAFAAVTSELQLEGSTRFTLSSHGTPLPLHPIVGEESYRIGCEAIMNAFRHANAQNVEIQIVYTKHAFQLSVGDNGSGINPQYLPPNIRPNHWGLHGMLERAEKIGGRLSIQRGAHSGTEIQLTVPAATAYRRIPRRLSQWLRVLTQLRP